MLFFARGSMCDFCVWFLSERAHLCGVGWLKLARTQNRGRAAAPNLGPFLFATKSGSAHWPRRQAQPGAVAAWNVCARRP